MKRIIKVFPSMPFGDSAWWNLGLPYIPWRNYVEIRMKDGRVCEGIPFERRRKSLDLLKTNE